MSFKSIEEIKKMGFSGFKNIGELFSDSSEIPKNKGVYLILYTKNTPIEFLSIGTGGHIKGKNPNVSVSYLKENWVENAMVVYIGKAGKEKSKATLQSRLRQYLRFGQGKNVGHWGGRLIWQIKKSDDLIVCWKTLKTKEPRAVEYELIQNFTSAFSKRPFANLTD